MDTKDPLSPVSKANHYFHVFFDHFSNYVVIVPTQENIAHYAANSLLHHWTSNIRPRQYLITDNRTENLNFEMANCCIV